MKKINDNDNVLSRQIIYKGNVFVVIICILFILSIVTSLTADENDLECPFLGRWKAVEFQESEVSGLNLNTMELYITFNEDNYIVEIKMSGFSQEEVTENIKYFTNSSNQWIVCEDKNCDTIVNIIDSNIILIEEPNFIATLMRD
ncbi:MAG: hypothetical protein LBS60_06115 [Deltaproteobacteria bacterium]|jgi:hypothetical protein|nr:hypothetical protein [Deltaproteobacteria bacterium]